MSCRAKVDGIRILDDVDCVAINETDLPPSEIEGRVTDPGLKIPDEADAVGDPRPGPQGIAAPGAHAAPSLADAVERLGAEPTDKAAN